MTEEANNACAAASADAPDGHRLCEMFWTLGPAFSRWAESHLKEQGHTPQRMRLIAFLYKKGPMKMSELSDALGVTATTVTALVDALEKGGTVTRQPHPTDRRAILITLTEAARCQFANLCGPFKDKVSTIFDVFTEAERKQLLALLLRMRDALAERNITD
jgi:DNA-binding MarR family transcriptional regulator